jgi:hypothetical protein
MPEKEPGAENSVAVAVPSHGARTSATAQVLAEHREIIYAKPPFGGPERVLAYLASYAHRTAIANSRLVAVDGDHVTFSYKDYRRGGRSGVMRLVPHEFIRPFSSTSCPTASTASDICGRPLVKRFLTV